MAYNTQDDVALGQLGSAYVTGTNAYTPPSGMVIRQIYCLTSNCKFSAITPEGPGDATYKSPVTSANAAEPGGLSFGTSTNTTAANGTNFTNYPATNVMKQGMTFFGRWKSVQLHSSSGAHAFIVYLGY
tara:strand:+ start:42 stop:428 length:387 start_codon:yes stop_codon:yes gene_type:complete